MHWSEYDDRVDPYPGEEWEKQRQDRFMSYDTQMDKEVREAEEAIKNAGKVIGRAAFADDEDCTFDKERLLKIATGIKELLS